MFCFIVCLLLWNAYAFEFGPGPRCQVARFDNHLHMTRVAPKPQSTECTFVLPDYPIYIEFERYAGSEIDKEAWLNFTFVGEYTFHIAVSNQMIVTSKGMFSMPTMTMLEHTMWLRLHQVDQQTLVEFAPPESKYFGPIMNVSVSMPKLLRVSAYTKTGMEQVVNRILHAFPKDDEPTYVLKKSVEHIEKRILSIEKRIAYVESINTQLGNRHQQHVEKHYAQSKRINEMYNALPTEEIQRLQMSMSYWKMVSVSLIVAGLFASLRSYVRHKKNRRWTL